MKVLQPDLPFEELYDLAKETVPLFRQALEDHLEDLKSRHPGVFDDFEIIIAPVKAEEKARTKAEKKYGGNHRNIDDFVRGTVQSPNPKALDIFYHSLGDRFALGDEGKNNFSKPTMTGMRNANQPIVLENGMVAELQLHHPAISAVKEMTHEPYDRINDISRSAKSRPLTDQEKAEIVVCLEKCREIHGVAAAKAGLNDLLDDEFKNDRRFVRQEWNRDDLKDKSPLETIFVIAAKGSGLLEAVKNIPASEQILVSAYQREFGKAASGEDAGRPPAPPITMRGNIIPSPFPPSQTQ